MRDSYRSCVIRERQAIRIPLRGTDDRDIDLASSPLLTFCVYFKHTIKWKRFPFTSAVSKRLANPTEIILAPNPIKPTLIVLSLHMTQMVPSVFFRPCHSLLPGSQLAHPPWDSRVHLLCYMSACITTSADSLRFISCIKQHFYVLLPFVPLPRSDLGHSLHFWHRILVKYSIRMSACWHYCRASFTPPPTHR